MVTVTNFGPVRCLKCSNSVCCAQRAVDEGWELLIVRDDAAYYCPTCAMNDPIDVLFEFPDVENVR